MHYYSRTTFTRSLGSGLTYLALLCFFVAATNAQTFTDDFENYTGRTLNNGNHWFQSYIAGADSGEPNYDDSGWMPYYQRSVLRDPPIVIAAGGPYSGAPSGYQDTQGMSNLDGGTPHGSSRLINANGSAVPANSTVILQTHVNMANVLSGNSNLFIGDASLASTDEWSNVAAILKSAGGGGLGVGANGPEPSSPLDWSQGYLQVKLEADIDEFGMISQGRSYSRPATGGEWTLAATIGAPATFPATHVGFHVALKATIDNFTVILPTVPSDFAWGVDAPGDWNLADNWSPAGVPNDRETNVVFGGAISTNVDVAVDSAITVNSVTFDNSNSYVVHGTGSVNLQANSLQLLPTMTTLAGAHRFAVDVALVNDTTVDVANGSTLSFQALELAGNTITQTGPGTLTIDGTPLETLGSVVASSGTIDGTGTVGGELDNQGATVAPGPGIGRLNVAATYQQSSTGTLAIEVAGTGAAGDAAGHDQLSAAGTTTLDGTLEVSATGFDGTRGQDYTISVVTGGSRSGTFASAPAAGTHLGFGLFAGNGQGGNALSYTGTSAQFTYLAASAGDADGDRDVDITDFNSLASSFDPNGANSASNNWTTADFDSDGDIDITDFNALASHFAPGGYGASSGQIPEPGAFFLLVVGGTLLGVAGLRQQKKKPSFEGNRNH